MADTKHNECELVESNEKPQETFVKIVESNEDSKGSFGEYYPIILKSAIEGHIINVKLVAAEYSAYRLLYIMSPDIMYIFITIMKYYGHGTSVIDELSRISNVFFKAFVSCEMVLFQNASFVNDEEMRIFHTHNVVEIYCTQKTYNKILKEKLFDANKIRMDRVTHK
jgi:hypothetical protein